MTGQNKKMNFPYLKQIRVNEQQKDNWDNEKIRSFLDGNFDNRETELIDKLLLLMVKAGINSEEYGVDIKESEIESNIQRLMECGKIG